MISKSTALNPKHHTSLSSDDDSIPALCIMSFSNKTESINVKNTQKQHNLEEGTAAASSCAAAAIRELVNE